MIEAKFGKNLGGSTNGKIVSASNGNAERLVLIGNLTDWLHPRVLYQNDWQAVPWQSRSPAIDHVLKGDPSETARTQGTQGNVSR